jgi:hypothetical protein
VAVDDRAQVLAFEQLHHQIGEAVVLLADVEDDGDVGVLECGGDLRLPFEPGQAPLGDGDLRRQHLHRDRAAQPLVDGPPDLAHAAPPDQGLQAVPASELLSGGRAGPAAHPRLRAALITDDDYAVAKTGLST